MNKFNLLIIIMGIIIVSGCDKIAPPAENTGVPREEIRMVATPGFAPRLLEAPVLGVYIPDIPYSVRSRGVASAGNDGKNHIALEFWGVSVESAEQKVQDQMIAAGFKQLSRSSGNGFLISRYGNDKYPDVLINVAPMAARTPMTPDGIGTIYFEWKN